MLYIAGIEMVHVLLKLLLKITGYQIFSVKKYKLCLLEQLLVVLPLPNVCKPI